jgi:glycosyltransferase involved in cell wall biosynthesis
MKILFMLDTPMAYQSGIWFHRNETPSTALSNRGHGIKQVAIGYTVPQQLMEWPDTVIFGRTYPAAYDPIKIMREYKKLGKRVLYDMDDDFWQVAKDNPSANVSNALKDQYEGMIREADAVITPSAILAKKFKKYFNKPVFICPNGIDYTVYQERPREHQELIVGYMGAASHWKDLQLIGEVVEKLSEKYDFFFTIYGLTGEPLEAAVYSYQKILANNWQPEKNEYFKSALDFYAQLKRVKLLHIPFMPPELHPSVLSRADFDIGLAPLEDTEFNRGKSCIKYYEYASVGTVTLASDVEPYKSEATYRAKNTFKDWYNKLEKLIVDKEFRDKLLAEQQKWVKENRSVEAIGVAWELACQQPGGLKVLNQEN